MLCCLRWEGLFGCCLTADYAERRLGAALNHSPSVLGHRVGRDALAVTQRTSHLVSLRQSYIEELTTAEPQKGDTRTRMVELLQENHPPHYLLIPSSRKPKAGLENSGFLLKHSTVFKRFVMCNIL